jgi:hypothetical protein
VTVRPSQTAPQLEGADDAALVSAMRSRRGLEAAGVGSSFWLTRSVFLRALAGIYAVAFAVLCQQVVPLIGAQGLLPAEVYLERIGAVTSFWQQPSLFWFGCSDRMLQLSAASGLLLSLLAVCGVDHALLMAALWVLYLSFVHVGQIFYGYGWETLLLEAGFLSIFLGPWTKFRSLRDATPPPTVMFIWLWWLLFRVMFGAGMIKLRGDACWRDLSCLFYHYETQPVPHALSRILHFAPRWFHQLGVLFNHFVELVVPFGLFCRRRIRHAAVACVIAFQGFLIASGNLSFLNWLTMAIALGGLDDGVWRKLLPSRWLLRSEQLTANARPNRARTCFVVAYSIAVVLLSISPALNMLSPRQQMNTSFEPLHLVNSYGAFGSIGRERDEIILEGTTDHTLSNATRWRPYEFKCKPGDVRRTPCWITPYHYRLDWQMWFAAMSRIDHEPWLVNLIYKLLQNDPAQLALLDGNPFPNMPPRYIRAELYRYHFAALGSGRYWRRERVAGYLPAVSLQDGSLHAFLLQYGLVPISSRARHPVAR